MTSMNFEPIQLTRGQAVRKWIKDHNPPWIALTILFLLLFCGLFANFIVGDPMTNDLKARQIAPFTDIHHIFGTDILGKDMTARLVYGCRSVLLVTAPSIIVALLIGTAVGLLAGYARGWVDSILMRITDATLGFPSILVAMLIVTFVGTGYTGVIIAVTATTWARFARMIRGEVLSVRERDFVVLAGILGVSPVMIMWRHLMPNVINTLMVMISLMIGQVILLEASLSFLGIGMSPGEPAWGIMVAEGRQQLLTTWWVSLFPGILITLVVMAFNFFGDWLRDYLDPRLRRAR
ncbi:MAG: ABC transporter permease [SAR202 cluster bacterium]|nr:ABC transporter permease [SAR202 cluster bacterium]